jgi:O-antigen/teichoic acid export membrane protein
MVIILFFSSYLTSGVRLILESKEKLMAYVKNIMFFYIFIALSIFMFSEVIYNILYPVQYHHANHYLAMFMVALPFTIISYFGMYYFNYIKKTYLNVLVLVIVFLFKFFLLYVMAFEEIELFIYLLISIEVLLGLIYLILLIKNMNGAYNENITD